VLARETNGAVRGAIFETMGRSPRTAPGVPPVAPSAFEVVTLTRAEWEAIHTICKGYSANHLEVSRARREMERVKRISKPVWRACKVVAAQMRNEMSYAYRSGQVPAGRIFDWEMRLRHSMDVSWSDLPANHPKRMVDRGRSVAGRSEPGRGGLGGRGRNGVRGSAQQERRGQSDRHRQIANPH